MTTRITNSTSSASSIESAVKGLHLGSSGFFELETFSKREELFQDVEKTLQKSSSLSATFEKIGSAVKDLFAAVEIKRNTTPWKALSLHPDRSTEKSNDSLLIQALDLETSRRDTTDIEKKATDFTESDNDESALKTMTQLGKNFRFFRRVASSDSIPDFLKGYALYSLKTKHLPDFKETGKVLGEGVDGRISEVSFAPALYARKTFFSNERAGAPKFFTPSEKEASIALKLSHPYVMTPLLGDDSRLLYPKAVGTMLLLREKPHLFSSDDVVAILRKVAEGVCHIHSLGFAYRDLKLDNILLQKDVLGELSPLIADPSFACHTSDKESLAEQLGTPAYISKELAKAYLEDTVVDGRTYLQADVYAFGMMIFEILCQENYESPLVDKTNPNGCLPEDLDKLFAIITSFPSLTKEHLESLLDPAKRKAYDPQGGLFNLMCLCFEEKPGKRPIMYQIAKYLGA